MYVKHTQSRFNNNGVWNVYRTQVTETSVTGVMKIANMSRAVSAPTSLAFWASMLTITPPRLLDFTTTLTIWDRA